MVDPLRAKAKVLIYVTLAFLFGIGLASGLEWTEGSYAGLAAARVEALQSAPGRTAIPAEVVQPALALNRAFEAISDAVTPAVVRIQVEKVRTVSVHRRVMPIPDEFRRFFDFPSPDQEQGRAIPEFAGGSGFVVSEDGYILTNNHVVGDADKIKVWLKDGREFTAKLVGTDPTTDVAVIKIEAKGLPTVSFGDSDAARVGEWVLAIGNPGIGGSSLDYTVTAGIVSAKGRPLGIIQGNLEENPELSPIANYAIENFIQTDAVINPGNSGGPLVNLRGEVIGVNTAIASRTGYYEGYGFAIPVNLARRVMADLIAYGRVRRAWLGVAIRTVTTEDAEYYKLPRVAGVLVNDYGAEDSPAKKAGIEPGDVIVAVNGEPVDRSGELQQRIASHKPGETVTLRVYRNGQPRDVQVRLGEAPFTTEAPRTVAKSARPEEKLGISVRDLTPELARRLGYERGGGAVIVGVDPYSPAARYGLYQLVRGEGSLRIVSINGQRIESAEEAKKALQGLKSGDLVSLVLESPAGRRQIVNMRIPE